ncbi:hypothetical protein AB0B85_32875 [Micromonospora sp. NPDC049044]|uniref:hypothetical protein n=1 Tax=Micromonospora sp. NPDC049044 TaxID=3154827 RepID=UPI0033C2E3D8
MSNQIEFTPRDLQVATFALSAKRVRFSAPNDYEVGMGNVGKYATISPETRSYFKNILSFSVERRDADRHLSRLLTLAAEYNNSLSAPLCLWLKESMQRLPESRYAAVRRNCGLLVECLGTLAYFRKKTGLPVAQLDVVYWFNHAYGIKVSRDAAKTSLVKLSEAGLVGLKLGEKNRHPSAVKLLTGVDYIGNSYVMRGSEEEADFIRNAERYADVFEGLKKDQNLRRKAKEAMKSEYRDKMLGEELEASIRVEEFLKSGRSLISM